MLVTVMKCPLLRSRMQRSIWQTTLGIWTAFTRTPRTRKLGAHSGETDVTVLGIPIGAKALLRSAGATEAASRNRQEPSNESKPNWCVDCVFPQYLVAECVEEGRTKTRFSERNFNLGARAGRDYSLRQFHSYE